MNEVNPNIPELYAKFKHPSFTDKIDTLIQRFKKYPVDKKRELRYKIEKELRRQPGRYPLDNIVFRTDSTIKQIGFSCNFKRMIEKDTFNVNLWFNNENGILVQKHKKDFHPEIEISKDKEGSAFHVLHLPEGYKIPVGPIYFKEESRLMTQEELDSSKAKTFKTIKVFKDKEGWKKIIETIHEMDKKFPPKKHLARYFDWQPDIPDTPTKIAIDFDAIKPSEMGLKPENAPVFHQKIVITEENLANL